MKKVKLNKLFFTVIAGIILPAILSADETFTLSGTVGNLKKAGTVYIRLFNEYQFNKKIEPDFTVKINTEDKDEVSFEFTDIPAGFYAIKCIQDVNGNGRLDKSFYGPKEPYGFYREKARIMKSPKFDELSFYIDKDIIGIKILLK